MKKSLVLGLAVAGAAGSMCGCITTPAPEGQAYSAYAIGDRTRVALEEIIVSLPLKGATQPYQNLHVGLAATINPVKTTLYAPYTVTDILQRLEPRISARVVEVLSDKKMSSLDDMPALRVQMAQEAQAVVDEAMRHWQHGAEYEVKILVTSLYWTDPSVGRSPAVLRSWW
jgi:hypothetical protein